jgi:hypothetical protein
LRTPGDDLDHQTIGGLFGRLVESTEEYIRAELRVYREVLLHRLLRARLAVVFIVLALLIVAAAVTAILVGLAIALGPYVGPVAACFLVGFGGLAFAGLLIWIAVRRIASIVEEALGRTTHP